MPGVIKFKFDFSFTRIVFLDLEIFQEDGELKTSLHVKPTNKQLFLDYNSNHPEHCKQSLPYSQALRVVERCTSEPDREENLENLKSKFEERNYPTELVVKQFEKARKKKRIDLINQQRKQNVMDNKVRLIFTHTKANPPINKWIRECKYLLNKNDRAKDIGSRIQVASKQPKNMKQLVGGNKRGGGGSRVTPPYAGCSKCEKGCKVACPVLVETKTFKSFNTGKVYPIRQKVDCTSSWVIYLCSCKKCGGQYVGKSKTDFKRRHSNHKQEIKKEVGGLGHHYGGIGGCGYTNFSVVLIEEVEEKTMKYLAERELFWQHQLRVYVENGSNAHCYKKEI